MPSITIVCTRCTLANLESDRFCSGCGLPLGGVQADAGVGAEALGTYEAPEPADPDVERLIRDFVARSGFDVVTSGHGWRVTVPSRLDRKQGSISDRPAPTRRGSPCSLWSRSAAR